MNFKIVTYGSVKSKIDKDIKGSHWTKWIQPKYRCMVGQNTRLGPHSFGSKQKSFL